MNEVLNLIFLMCYSCSDFIVYLQVKHIKMNILIIIIIIIVTTKILLLLLIIIKCLLHDSISKKQNMNSGCNFRQHFCGELNFQDDIQYTSVFKNAITILFGTGSDNLFQFGPATAKSISACKNGSFH